ncbi:DNA-binding response regulator [Enterococcus gilvus]|nr:DNA-binding response regulator [Enterococcus gilvus]
MAMTIFILEDNVYQAKILFEDISKILSEKNLYSKTITIQIFHKSSELIKAVETTGEHYNLFFLDIKIKKDEVAGFTAGKQIRNLENNSLIFFVTSYANLALASYDYGINAFAYIVKDYSHQKYISQLKKCIASYLKGSTNLTKDSFIYETKYLKVSCPFTELMYITPVSPHKLLIKTSSKDIYAHGSLKDFDGLDRRLIRCHQSFVLNITNIKFVNKSKKEAHLTDGTIIPISRKKNKELTEAINSLNK